MVNHLKQTKSLIDFSKDQNAQSKYRDEMAQKTGYYQQKFDFETNPRKGHEYWNVEADAFKHAFGGADMYLKYGNIGSKLGGIHHELQTKNNPKNEWNMDSWNNQQGREIAKEIEKEYGDKFRTLPRQKQDDIIAVKVMYRMKNGQLITNPNDSRKYNNKLESGIYNIKSFIDKTSTPTGYASNLSQVPRAGLLDENTQYRKGLLEDNDYSSKPQQATNKPTIFRTDYQNKMVNALYGNSEEEFK